MYEEHFAVAILDVAAGQSAASGKRLPGPAVRRHENVETAKNREIPAILATGYYVNCDLRLKSMPSIASMSSERGAL